MEIILFLQKWDCLTWVVGDEVSGCGSVWCRLDRSGGGSCLGRARCGGGSLSWESEPSCERGFCWLAGKVALLRLQFCLVFFVWFLKWVCFFFNGSVGLRGFCVLFCFQGVFQLLKGNLLIVDARALASDNHSFQQVLSYLLSNLDGFHRRPFNSPVLEYTELIELRWALNVKGQYGVSLVGSSDSSFCLTILLLAVLGLVFVKALYWFVGDVLWFV